jgi:hypothetical protein
MRTHILTLLMALLMASCASLRGRDTDRTPAELPINQQRSQEAQMIDGQASRIH